MASRSSIESAGESGAVKAGVFRRLGTPIALVAAVLAATMLLASTASAQTTLTTGTALTSNWTAARWAASGTTYTSPWVAGGTSSFADGLSPRSGDWRPPPGRRRSDPSPPAPA